MTQPTDAPLAMDLGLEDVPDGFADGVYQGFCFACKTVKYKDETKGKAIVFTYKCIDPNSPFNNETIDEWKSANAGDDNQKKKFLKMRLDSLGIPATRMAQFTAADVVGKPVFFTVKKNGDYRNVTKVELRAPENQAAVQQYQDTNPVGQVSSSVSAGVAGLV